MNKVFNKKINKIVLSVLAVIVIIISLSFKDVNSITTTFKRIAHDIKLSSVDVSGFEISTILIDQSDGNAEYNSSYEWNATSTNSYKRLTYQINYRKTNPDTHYNPGELEIEVPNLLYELGDCTDPTYTYYQGFMDRINLISISGDPSGTTDYNYSWSYRKTSDNSKIIFTNNYEMEQDVNQEGSITVKYELYANSIPNNRSVDIASKLNNVTTSNSINIKVTSNKTNYSFSNTYNKMNSLDNLPSVDYTWVKVKINRSSVSGVRDVYINPGNDNSAYYEITVPDGVRVVDHNFNELEKENGKYKTQVYVEDYYSGKYSMYGLLEPFNGQEIYVGFPNSVYLQEDAPTGYIGTNIYGIYSVAKYDHSVETPNDGFELIGQVYDEIDVSEFEFHYSGALYKLDMDATTDFINAGNHDMDYDYLFNDVMATAYYVGHKMDVKLGTDLLLYKSLNGEVEEYPEDEYYIYRVIFPGYTCHAFDQHYEGCLANANGAIQQKKYDVDLYVRKRGSSEYVKDRTFKNQDYTIEFRDYDEVVGFYFLIHDMTESIYISVDVDYCIKDGNIEGEFDLYNFARLEVLHDGVAVNTPDSSNYGDSAVGQYVQSYDNRVYGANIQRDYLDIPVRYGSNRVYAPHNNPRASIYEDGINYVDMSIDVNPTYKTEYITDHFIGYELYDLLPEGAFIDPNDGITFDAASSYFYRAKDLYTNRGYEKDEYIENLKQHTRYEVIENFHNTGRTLVKIIVDYTDDPLNLLGFIDYYDYPSIKDIFTYRVYFYDTTSNKNGNLYYKSINEDVDYYGNDKYDVNDNGDTVEKIHSSSYTVYPPILSSYESKQDLTTFAKSDMSMFSTRKAKVDKNGNYQYKLRVRNIGEITNVVIYDSIENYIKKNGTYQLAKGSNDAFKGSFMGVDTSYAQSNGYNVKVYYSESETPGSLGDDSSWNEYVSGTTDNSLVKTLAFEFLTPSGEKAVISANSENILLINMKAPANSEALRTYNGSWSEWNALDGNSQIISNIVGIDSNSSILSIAIPVKVKHLDYNTHEELIPEETYYYAYGDEYSTSPTYSIPSYYYYKESSGDSASGTINKDSYEITYYYDLRPPEVNKDIQKEGTKKVTNRNSTYDYHIYTTNGNYIKNYVGDTSLTIVDTLPYAIDVSRSDLDGGIYDEENHTITWNYNYSSDSNHRTTMNLDINISVVYLEIPYSVRYLQNNVSEIITYDGNVQTENTSFSTSIEEPRTLTVQHLNNDTHEQIGDTQVFTVFCGDHYNTSPYDIFGYEIVEMPSNASGTMLGENITVTYYYRVFPAGKAHITKTGPEYVTGRNSEFNYSIILDEENYVVNYDAATVVLIEDFIPYEIDVERSNLNGGTYDPFNKMIKWTLVYSPDENGRTELARTIDYMVVYKDVPDNEGDWYNRVEETVYFANQELYSEDNCTTRNDMAASIRIMHLEYGTNNKLVEDTVGEGTVGSYYRTYPEDALLEDYLPIKPSNYYGYLSEGETVVIYYYKPIEIDTDFTFNKSGDSKMDYYRDSVSYGYNMNGYIYGAKGKQATLRIVDSLPYEIDTSTYYKSGLFNHFVYNANNKTLTYEITVNIDSNEYRLYDYYYFYFTYKDIPMDVREISNSMTATLTIGDYTEVFYDDIITEVDGPYQLTVYHRVIDTDEWLGSDSTKRYFEGDSYETSPREFDNATLAEVPENATGVFGNQDITVTYYYNKTGEENTDPYGEPSMSVSGNTYLNYSDSQAYYYTSVNDRYYNIPSYSDYTMTIVDHLPYEIDIERSTIDKNGVYDPISNTITWIITGKTYSSTSSSVYGNTGSLYLYFKNVPGEVRTITNNFSHTTQIGDLVLSSEKSYTSYIQRRADLWVNHLDVDTNEPVAPQEYFRTVAGRSYTTTPSDKVPANYDLVSSPENASGTIEEEYNTLNYLYKKRTPIITSSITKVGTDAVDHRVDAVDYTVTYAASITDYLGNATTTIVDTLPYGINASLSNLDGGVYDATNNTITWTHNENVESIEKQDYSYTHNISLVYADVPLSARSYSNSVTGTTTADDTSESSTANSSTEVNEKYTLKVKHLEYGTNTPLDDEETRELFYGESYTTSASSNIPANYKLKTTPDNANSTIQAEETVVTYYYEKKDTLLTSVTAIVGTDAITKRSNPVSYTITYNTSIKDHLGDATITIVDTLPYEIDTTKTYNLDGGVYNSTNKTITWTHNESITNIDTSKSYSHSITLVYKDVPISTRTLANSAVGTTVVGSKSESSNADASTDVNEKYTLRVKHLEYGTNTPLVDDETSELLYGASYTTSPSSNIPGNYKLKTTPGNANSTIQAEETIVTYYYEKKDVLLTSTIAKTGTSELTNRSNTVEYTITYTTTIKDHLGDATTTIVDTLPYEIDTTKTYNLDGGTYNSTNRTITWTHNENITDINTSKTYTHTISLVYKNMPISVRSIANSVTGTTTALSVNSSDTKTLTTAVNEAFNLKVKHLEYGTNTPVATEENRAVYYGDSYETSPSTSIPDNYKLKITPDNANSTIQAEETVVTYYYEKKDAIITSTLEKTGTSEVDNKTNAISYRISYNGSIKDFLGDATITIVDTLPYEIDTSLSNLNGGTYNNSDKTITWTNNINVTSINTTKSYTYNISVVYKNIPITVRSITNSVRATTAAGNGSDVKQANLATAINQPYTLRVKHLEYGTNTPVADEETYTKYGGDAYQTSASSNIPDNYELKITPTNNSGTIQAELTEVIYYYQKKDPVLSSSITKTGSESISSYDDLVEYTITYNSSIKDYIGSSSVSIIDTLPYEIDETASILDGGTYNSNTKTITWTNNENITSVAERNITYTYNIKLKYINISREDTVLSNTVSSTTTLSNKTDTKETTSNTNIEIKGKIIVQYIDIDTNEEISSEIESIDILNKEFVPESLDIKGYNLVQVPDKVKYYYDSETQTIKFLYRKMAVVKGVEEVIENPKTGKAYIYVLVCSALIFILIGAFKIAYSARVFRKF